MAKKDGYSRVRARRITPVVGMREFLGDSSFRMVMLVALLYVYLHQRVITAEIEYGSGGLWCSLGITAALCLAISVLMTHFGAKAKILPALVPILGLGGICTSLVMFFIVVIRRMAMGGGLLGILQEVTMLLFIAAWVICAALLMMTGIGMRVTPVAGIPAAIATIIALALFVIRAMYVFSSLVTALSRNLLLPDGEMSAQIQWVLRSVAPGGEEALTMYYGRLLDSVGLALLLMCCIPLALRFNGFFAEQAVIMKNSKDIPLPTERHVVYNGYEEYTEDIPAPKNEENFTITSEGYYVEKKVTERAKFKRRERAEGETRAADTTPVQTEEEAEAESAEENAVVDSGEVYDDYVPGEGWISFLKRNETEEDPTEEPPKAEPKRVRPVQTDRPAIDPNDPDFWNNYSS